MNVEAFNNKYRKYIITEALDHIDSSKAEKLDVKINVEGGGVMGQAQAARTAIARALVLYFQDKELEEKFKSIDRYLVVEDPRRVETKKYGGPKARARYQKSYR